MKSIFKASFSFTTNVLLLAVLSCGAIGVIQVVSPENAAAASSGIPMLDCIPFMNCDDTSSSDIKAQGLPGTWSQASFRNVFGSRDYYLYVPKKYNGQPIPLIVMLHGCTQSAPQFALETGMNWTAEKYGFAVLYPEQGYQDNIWRCWNWFRPENQTRNGGELGVVLGMMSEVSKNVRIDTHHVYAAGISSGAAMAANLLACHSDVFAGAGIASGLEFQAATSEAEAHDVMTSGSTHDIHQSADAAVKCTGAGAKTSAVIAIFGTADSTVNPVNSSRVIQQFTAMNDLLDDGQSNQSQNDRIIVTRDDQVPHGYHYRTDFYGGNGAIHLAKVSVNGMGHAWSGAVSSGQFADVRGPNAAEMVWIFLWNYGSR